VLENSTLLRSIEIFMELVMSVDFFVLDFADLLFLEA